MLVFFPVTFLKPGLRHGGRSSTGRFNYEAKASKSHETQRQLGPCPLGTVLHGSPPSRLHLRQKLPSCFSHCCFQTNLILTNYSLPVRPSFLPGSLLEVHCRPSESVQIVLLEEAAPRGWKEMACMGCSLQEACRHGKPVNSRGQGRERCLL